MASKLEFEIEVKSSLPKIWSSLVYECINLLPKVFPDVYEKVEVLQGDGTSPGSVRLMKFVTKEGSAMSSATEKVESLDDENKTMCYTIIDGEILKYLKNFKNTITVSAKDKDDGSLVKFVIEFDKGSEEIDGGEFYKGLAIKVVQDLDAYLLKA